MSLRDSLSIAGERNSPERLDPVELLVWGTDRGDGEFSLVGPDPEPRARPPRWEQYCGFAPTWTVSALRNLVSLSSRSMGNAPYDAVVDVQHGGRLVS